MLAIEAHHSTIGKYYDTATLLLPLHSIKTSSKGTYFQNRMLQMTYYHLRKIFLFTLVTVFILSNIQQRQINLKVSGDRESNSNSTYVIDKFLLVLFHQGDRRFGDTASIQCACNSLYVLCWSKVKKVFAWNSSDVDLYLVEGDLLYKSLNTTDLLSVDGLPRSVQLNVFLVLVTFFLGRGLETKMGTTAAGD